MAHPVVHWEIGAEDAEKLGAFYHEMFDWRITPAAPDYSLVAPEDGSVGGGLLQIDPDIPPYVALYVQVDELEPALRHAVELGASELVPPMTLPGIGRIAMIADPEGHPVGLLEPRDGDPAS